MLMLALLLGMFMPLFAGMMNGQIGKLAALPAVLIGALLLLYDRRMVLILILLFRSTADVYLDYTKLSLGGVQMGVGGLINLVVILMSIWFIAERPQLFPKKLALMWLPFIVYAGLSIIITLVKPDAIRFYLGLLSYYSIFICTTYLVRTPEDFRKMIMLVIWSSILPSVFTVVDVALHGTMAGFRLKSTR